MPSKDFAKKTAKVGRKRPAPSSETRINVKVAKLELERVYVPEAADSDEEQGGAGGVEEHSLPDTILLLRHHSVQLRRRALLSLRRRVEEDPSTLWSLGADVLLGLAARLSDQDPSVRCVALPVLAFVLSHLPPPSSSPAGPILAPYLASALTKLHTSIRLDAAAAVELIARANPVVASAISSSPSSTLFDSLVALLDPGLYSASSSPTLLTSVLDGSLGLGAALPSSEADKRDGAAAFSLARGKVSALHARLGVVAVLRSVLTLAGGGAGGGGTHTHTHTHTPRHSVSLWAASPGGPDREAGTTLGGGGGGGGRLPPSTLACAIFSVAQVWLDAGPEEAHEARGAHIEQLTLVAEVLFLLWRQLLSVVAASVPEPVVQGTLLLAGSPASGAEADTRVLSTLHAAAGGGAGTETPLTLLRLCARAVQAHVLRHLPVQPSKMGGGVHATDTLHRLNAQLVKLAAGMLPSRDALSTAGGHIVEMESTGALTSSTAGGRGSGGEGGDPATSNPFAALARPSASTHPDTDERPSSAPGKHKAAAAQPVDASTAASDPVADAYRRAWRAAVTSGGRLRKCVQACVRLQDVAARVAGVLLGQAASACDVRASHSSPRFAVWDGLATDVVGAVRVLLCTTAGDVARSLLESTLAAHHASAPTSTLRAECLACIEAILRSQALQPWATAASAAWGAGVDAPSFLLLLPKLLWSVGASHPPTADRALALLLDASLRSTPTSPTALALKEAVRTLTPLLYTVKGGGGAAAAAQGGGGAAAVPVSAPTPVFGPWKDYTPGMQAKLLALIEVSGAVASLPLLRRGLSVCARAACVTPPTRALLLASTTRALLSAGVGEGAEHDGRGGPDGVAPALAWLVGTLTGHACDVSADGGLTLGGPSDAEAGVPLPPGAPLALPFLTTPQLYSELAAAVVPSLQAVAHAARASGSPSPFPAALSAVRPILTIPGADGGSPAPGAVHACVSLWTVRETLLLRALVRGMLTQEAGSSGGSTAGGGAHPALLAAASALLVREALDEVNARLLAPGEGGGGEVQVHLHGQGADHRLLPLLRGAEHDACMQAVVQLSLVACASCWSWEASALHSRVLPSVRAAHVVLASLPPDMRSGRGGEPLRVLLAAAAPLCTGPPTIVEAHASQAAADVQVAALRLRDAARTLLARCT